MEQVHLGYEELGKLAQTISQGFEVLLAEVQSLSRREADLKHRLNSVLEEVREEHLYVLIFIHLRQMMRKQISSRSRATLVAVSDL